MQSSSVPRFPDLRTSQIVVADGFGLRISVARGHLAVEDGVGKSRRTRRFNRAGSGLRRLVVLGSSGFVTFEALRFLNDIGAGFVHIDRDGHMLTSSALQRVNDSALRRAQALAQAGEIGLDITRELLKGKITGQADVLLRLGAAQHANMVRKVSTKLQAAQSFDEMRSIEAEAAARYYKRWETVAFPIAPRDQEFVPSGWLQFGPRISPISGQRTFAGNPGNCVRNYLAALLEAESTFACLRIGLDVGLGFLHADKRGRDSLALDLMEVARPLVDEFILELIENRVFSRRDFAETRQGCVRVLAPLSHQLAESMPRWSEVLVPVAEWVAETLRGSEAPRVRRSSQLRLSAPPSEPRHKSRIPLRKERASGPRVRACYGCGVVLTRPRANLCDDCRLIANRAGVSKAHRRLEDLRAEGKGPGVSAMARAKRTAKMREHAEAIRAWDEQHREPEEFTSEILPALREIPTPQLMAATGLSRVYCSMIRAGRYVPHVRHWETLRNLARR